MATQTITHERSILPISSIELQSYSLESGNITDANKNGGTRTRVNSNTLGHGDIREDILPPPTAASVVQQWNTPRSNMWMVFAAFLSMMVSGLNDAAYGVSNTTMSRKFYAYNL